MKSRKLPFMLIGGQAVLLHGEPRLTQDIDITLGVGPDRLDDLTALCREIELGLLPDDVEEFVRTTFVLPVKDSDSGVRVDFVFSNTPYERKAIARAVLVELGGVRVPFASAEDLIIHKLFAGRPRDLEDAAGVVHRKGGELDWEYIQFWAAQFAEVPGRGDLTDQVKDLRGGAV